MARDLPRDYPSDYSHNKLKFTLTADFIAADLIDLNSNEISQYPLNLLSSNDLKDVFNRLNPNDVKQILFKMDVENLKAIKMNFPSLLDSEYLIKQTK